jgi:methanogenic corrinoid protein MtbC1
MTEDLFAAMRQSVIDGESDAAVEPAARALAAGEDAVGAVTVTRGLVGA